MNLTTLSRYALILFVGLVPFGVNLLLRKIGIHGLIPDGLFHLAGLGLAVIVADHTPRPLP